jgi:hypothetical protein
VTLDLVVLWPGVRRVVDGVGLAVGYANHDEAVMCKCQQCCRIRSHVGIRFWAFLEFVTLVMLA